MPGHGPCRPMSHRRYGGLKISNKYLPHNSLKAGIDQGLIPPFKNRSNFGCICQFVYQLMFILLFTRNPKIQRRQLRSHRELTPFFHMIQERDQILSSIVCVPVFSSIMVRASSSTVISNFLGGYFSSYIIESSLPYTVYVKFITSPQIS